MKANELQTQAIQMEADATTAAVRRNMPTLIVRVNGRSVEGTVATVELPVENRGGWCRDVLVVSDWQDAPVEPPVLQTNGSGIAKATTRDWVRGSSPVPASVRFKDDQGQEHSMDLRESGPGTWTTV